MQGEITAEGVIPILTRVETQRVSGLLRFSGTQEGEILLVAGQIAAEQEERPDGDVVEFFLAERSGTYEVMQRLPSLSVSRGDHACREGSLAVHVPADLMNYCERAGLTGTLEFIRPGAQAEVVYAAGEMDEIRLDGPGDLSEVFSWEEGSFLVRVAEPTAVEEVEEPSSTESMDETRPFIRQRPGKPTRPDSTGKLLLKVVEFTVSDILRDREDRRPETRTSPPQPPPPKTKKHASLPPPKKRAPRKDQTVRVVFLDADRSLASAPISSEDRNPSATESSPSPTAPKRPKAKPSMTQENAEASAKDKPAGPTWLWALVVVVVAFFALMLLSALPALE